MGEEGYRFRFATSRLSIVLAAAGALGSGAVGALALTGGLAAIGPGSAAGAAAIATGAALILIAAVVLHRAMIQSYDCRIGEAGVFVATIWGERFVGWTEIQRFDARGRIIRIAYRAVGREVETWVEAPRRAEIELARVVTFAKSRLPAARAAAM
jgi:hypothetical protein